MKMEENNKIINNRKRPIDRITLGCMALLAVFLILSTISFVSAEFWACFNDGDVVHYCNNYKPERTCDSSGGCTLCMSRYNETEDCYIHGAWPRCMRLDTNCSMLGGNTTLDITPPEITLNSPAQDGIYNKRAVLLDLSVNEESDIYYLDNIYGRGRWTRICNDCYDYNNSRSFKEGLNNITIRATDGMGNEAFLDVTFFVDFKNPIIKKTEPKRNSFFNGNFWIQYYELNVREVKIFYGNSGTGYREGILSGCASGKKEECDIDVDLEDYDGQEIEYWFVIKDIADNIDESKHILGEVDITPPLINSINYSIDGRRVNFEISITEENFDEVSYYDSGETRPRWRILCSRLREGVCSVRKTFSYGEHDLTIQALDRAGNRIGEGLSFVI